MGRIVNHSVKKTAQSSLSSQGGLKGQQQDTTKALQQLKQMQQKLQLQQKEQQDLAIKQALKVLGQQQDEEQQTQRVRSASAVGSSGVIRLGTHKAQEGVDDVFNSGAWLFDSERIPTWLKAQLPILSRSGSQSLLRQQRPGQVQQQQQVSKQELPQGKQQLHKDLPQGKQQQQVLQHAPAKGAKGSVVRLGSIQAREDVDDAFFSGAWLFDDARAPSWLKTQIPQQQQQQLRLKNQMHGGVQEKKQMHRSQSARGSEVILLGSIKVNENPDDAFFSGAWMFDEKRAPSWLASELFIPSKRTMQSERSQKNGMQNIQPKQQILQKEQQQQQPLLQMKQQQLRSQSARSGGKVIPLGFFRAFESPDDAFFSGAWIFDATRAPAWLISEIPLSRQGNILAKKHISSSTQPSLNSTLQRPVGQAVGTGSPSQPKGRKMRKH